MNRSFAILMLLGSLGLSMLGCATSSASGVGVTNYAHGSEPDIWEQSGAHPAAFTTFNIRKRMPIGMKNNFDFYYKTCAGVSPVSWYSKTSYECNGP